LADEDAQDEIDKVVDVEYIKRFVVYNEDDQV
jgi:hypothetical protein